jgi:hypothetical protein
MVKVKAANGTADHEQADEESDLINSLTSQ